MRNTTHFAASPAEVLVAARPDTATSTEFGAIPRFLFDSRDAQIIEAYYRYQVTSAIESTPDVHWVSGMLGSLTDGDGAIVAGIRLNMKLSGGPVDGLPLETPATHRYNAQVHCATLEDGPRSRPVQRHQAWSSKEMAAPSDNNDSTELPPDRLWQPTTAK